MTTKEGLDWMAVRHPKPPGLSFDIDRGDLRAEANAAARAELQARINRMREEFRARPQKARGDFSTARDYSRPQNER